MPTFSICPRDWSAELPIATAVDAIRQAFPSAVVSFERGQERALAVLQRLRELNAPENVQAVYVDGASQAVMIALPISEANGSLEFMLMPGEGIHLSSTIADVTIADKLARALGYEYEEIG